MPADQSRFTVNDNNGLSTASAAIYAAKLRPFCIQQTILRVCDITSEQHEQQLTLETVDVFSADRVVAQRPAVAFAVPESVAADFSVRLLGLALRQTPIFRDHR